jgi:hypothetical protein
MKVSVPAPPRPVTGDLALVGPPTEGPSRDVQERRREPDSNPLAAGRARARGAPEYAGGDAGAACQGGGGSEGEGGPGEPREAILGLAEIAQEPAIRGSMQSARARNVAGTEGNAVHGRLPPGQGCAVGVGAPGSMCPIGRQPATASAFINEYRDRTRNLCEVVIFRMLCHASRALGSVGARGYAFAERVLGDPKTYPCCQCSGHRGIGYGGLPCGRIRGMASWL